MVFVDDSVLISKGFKALEKLETRLEKNWSAGLHLEDGSLLSRRQKRKYLPYSIISNQF